jgi:hypothetical protein
MLNDRQELQIMNFIASITEKGRHVESGQDMWGIRDMATFVQRLMEFLDRLKNESTNRR